MQFLIFLNNFNKYPMLTLNTELDIDLATLIYSHFDMRSTQILMTYQKFRTGIAMC